MPWKERPSNNPSTSSVARIFVASPIFVVSMAIGPMADLRTNMEMRRRERIRRDEMEERQTMKKKTRSSTTTPRKRRRLRRER